MTIAPANPRPRHDPDNQNALGAGVSDQGRGHENGDTHARPAPAFNISPDGQQRFDTQQTNAVGGKQVFPPILYTFAAALHDVETQKNGLRNRIRILTTPMDEPDKDGICRGFGFDPDHPEVQTLQALFKMMENVDSQATKNLEKAFKDHSLLYPYVESTPGLGAKTVARLLGCIKDPYINSATGKPRTVSQLWAYCGLHVIDGESARRKKGIQANWSTEAKTRAYIIAEGMMKNRKSAYRHVYDKRREYTGVTHPEWTDGHRNSDALRIVSKRMLRDLWRESRRLHTGLPHDVIEHSA